MSNRSSTIVALCGTKSTPKASLSKSSQRNWDRIQLPDLSCPSCLKNYWLWGTDIYEIQVVDVDFSSYFVNGYVVSNGQLHTMTPVDPLFFILARIGTEPSTSWKPLDQIFDEILDELTESDRNTLLTSITSERTTTRQYTHILECLELSQDEFVYKLSPTKVLNWLQRKQQAAESILRLQEQRNHSKEQSSFAKGFILGGDDACEDESITTEKVSRAHKEAIQIVCQYLSPIWRDRFLNHLNVSAEEVMEEKVASKKQKSTVASNWHAGLTGCGTSEATQKGEESIRKQTITVGAKQLQKVSTKGMSKLSNFFKPKQKK